MDESRFRHVCIQDGKLWAMTEQSGTIIRDDLVEETQSTYIDDKFK